MSTTLPYIKCKRHPLNILNSQEKDLIFKNRHNQVRLTAKYRARLELSHINGKYVPSTATSRQTLHWHQLFDSGL